MDMTDSPIDLDDDDESCLTENTEDPPLKHMLKCLINNETKQSTILTNFQLMEILKKHYDMDVYALQVAEVEMYMNILKKFLKDWSKWEEFDQKMRPLRLVGDYKSMKILIEEQYQALVEHLRDAVSLAKPLIDEAVKDCKQEPPVPDECGDIVMEVVCSRDQLNQLFYRRPTSDLSTSVFNTDSFIQSRINLATWSVASILHMWNVKVSITVNNLVYKREMTHSLKHFLLNKNHTFVQAKDPLSLDFQMKSSRPKDAAKNQLLNIFQTILLKNQGTHIYSLLEEVLSIVQSDLKDAPNVLSVPAKYRRYMSKYPYIRYLYSENTKPRQVATNQMYDLQLEETVAPMFQISIGKLEATDLEMPSLEDWFVIECGYCKVKFHGEDMHRALETHFNEQHQNEPEWTCSNCLKTFQVKLLTELKWAHSC